MAEPKPFAIHDHLFLLAQGAEGSPRALRVDLKQLCLAAAFVAGLFALAILGTLLFFREMELNRKLHDRVLELEGSLQLVKFSHPPTRTSALASTAAAMPAAAPSAPIVEVAPPLSVAPPEAKTAPVTTAPVRARLGDFSVDCLDGTCTVRLGMVPTASGVAQGELLVVLETEVPRIGTTAGLQQEMRKRYFLYPGNGTREDLDPNNLSQIARKPFKFSRVLQSNIPFAIGQVLRPLAANVYIFDTEGNLAHHERKPVKTEE